MTPIGDGSMYMRDTTKVNCFWSVTHHKILKEPNLMSNNSIRLHNCENFGSSKKCSNGNSIQTQCTMCGECDVSKSGCQGIVTKR